MRVTVLGGGPGGLYCATLWKQRHPNYDVALIEQNPADSTFGFGVVFSDKALEFLRSDDPETVDLITPHMEQWRDITLNLRGEDITIDGIGFSAIGRLKLLTLLLQRARETGVKLIHNKTVQSLDELRDADLIIGADGLNSLVRRSFNAEFETSIGTLGNKFAWFGTSQQFNTLTQTFVESPHGPFNAHHYRYSPDMSTFIVECSDTTWAAAGLDRMSEDSSRLHCQAIFADCLKGHELVSNKSLWRNFPTLRCNKWVHENMALIGDAAHSAHFSIGSGTRLALEDAIALVKSLEQFEGNISAGLAHYDETRRPIARKIVNASLTSAAWYENFGEHMPLPLHEFAMRYITRSGRLDFARLSAMAPQFAETYLRAGGVAV